MVNILYIWQIISNVQPCMSFAGNSGFSSVLWCNGQMCNECTFKSHPVFLDVLSHIHPGPLPLIVIRCSQTTRGGRACWGCNSADCLDTCRHLSISCYLHPRFHTYLSASALIRTPCQCAPAPCRPRGKSSGTSKAHPPGFVVHAHMNKRANSLIVLDARLFESTRKFDAPRHCSVKNLTQGKLQ